MYLLRPPPMPNPKYSDLDLTGTGPPWGLLGQGLSHHRSSHLAALSLTGELAALKNRVFVLKEGVDYKVKITFKVRELSLGTPASHRPSPPQVPPNTVCPSGQ